MIPWLKDETCLSNSTAGPPHKHEWFYHLFLPSECGSWAFRERFVYTRLFLSMCYELLYPSIVNLQKKHFPFGKLLWRLKRTSMTFSSASFVIISSATGSHHNIDKRHYVSFVISNQAPSQKKPHQLDMHTIRKTRCSMTWQDMTQTSPTCKRVIMTTPLPHFGRLPSAPLTS